MALKSPATMEFKDYEVQDGGIQLQFYCPDPGGGEQSDWYVFLTDAELATINNLATFNTLVTNKLQRKFRAQGIASRLDSLKGRSITI